MSRAVRRAEQLLEALRGQCRGLREEREDATSVVVDDDDPQIAVAAVQWRSGRRRREGRRCRRRGRRSSSRRGRHQGRWRPRHRCRWPPGWRGRPPSVRRTTRGRERASTRRRRGGRRRGAARRPCGQCRARTAAVSVDRKSTIAFSARSLALIQSADQPVAGRAPRGELGEDAELRTPGGRSRRGDPGR